MLIIILSNYQVSSAFKARCQILANTIWAQCHGAAIVQKVAKHKQICVLEKVTSPNTSHMCMCTSALTCTLLRSSTKLYVKFLYPPQMGPCSKNIHSLILQQISSRIVYEKNCKRFDLLERYSSRSSCFLVFDTPETCTVYLALGVC